MIVTILDTETTGTDPTKHALIELAMARVELDTGLLVDVRSMLVVRTRGEHGAEEIHGINEWLPDRYGVDPEKLGTGLRAWVAGSECVVAHNAEFDRQWLPELGVPWADSMDFEWPRPSPGRSLTAIALAHGVGVVAAHRAVDDVLTLARLMERSRELGADLIAMVQRAMRPKVKLQALVSYADRQMAKDAGFRWTGDAWVRSAFRDETFPFQTKEIER